MNQNFGLNVQRRYLSTRVSKFFGSFPKTHFCSKSPMGIFGSYWLEAVQRPTVLYWQNIYLALYFLWGGSIFSFEFKGAGIRVRCDNLMQDSKRTTTEDDKSNIFLFWEFLWFLFNRFFSTLFFYDQYYLYT